ncbi:MAG: PAS domain S-box protein, partial [Chloroflexota bacterium]|nr:PAS domain S-box protein [Chloroflexota bacterium]
MTDKKQAEIIQTEIDSGENFYQTLFENSADAYLILDNNIFVYCNQATVEMLYADSKQEVLSTHPSQLSPEAQPDGRLSSEKADEMISIALEQGSNRFEWTHRRITGEDFVVEVLLTPITIGEKTIIHTTWRNVSERKRAEAKLQESEARFRTIVENSQSGILILNETFEFIYVNDTLCQMLGNSQEEIIGLDFRTILDEESKQIVIDRYIRRQRGEEVPPRYKFSIIRSDGEKRRVEISASLIHDAEGRSRNIGQVIDITEQAQAEKELQESEERFRTLFNSSKDAIMTIAPPTWKFTSGNPTILDMFKVKSEEEFTSLGPWDVSPEKQPDGRLSDEKAQKMIQTAMEAGSNFFNWTHKRITGEEFPATILLARVDLADRSFLQATVRDITKQTQMEQQSRETMERRGKQLLLTTEIVQDISSASGLEEIYERVVTLVKERFGYYHAQIFRHDPEKNTMVVIKGYGMAGQTMLDAKHNLPYGKGVVGIAASTGEPVLASDVTEDPNWIPHPNLPDTQGELAIPIKWQNEVLG